MLNSIPKRDDVQVIVVDDNSDPNIVDFTHFPGLNKHNTEVYFTKEGKGPGAARNFGLTKAKGDWILFADADDYYDTENLLYLLDNSVSSNFDVIFFGVNNSFYGFEKDSRKIRYCDSQQKLNLLKVLAPWNKIIRHHFLTDNKIEFDNLFYCEDQIISARLVCECQRVGLYANTVYWHISNQDSLSKTSNLQRLAEGYLVEIKFNKYLKNRNLLSLTCRNYLLGGLLYRIYCISPWRYRCYVLYEFILFGWDIFWADYSESCVQRCIHPNIFRQLFDPIRVKLGYIRKKVKNAN